MLVRLRTLALVVSVASLAACGPAGQGNTGGGTGSTGGGSAQTGGGAGQTGGGSGQTGGGTSQTGGGDGVTGGGSGQTGGGDGTTGGGSGQTGGGDGTTGGGSAQTGGGDGTTGGGSGQTGGGDDAGVDLPDASIADAGVVLTCSPGWIQCGSSCIDPSNSYDNCGFCGHTCTATTNALSGACVNSTCAIPACTFPYVDVDHSYENGCEGTQDFALSFNEGSVEANPDGGAPTLRLTAGSTAALDVVITRTNWSGASINMNFAQLSGTAIYAPDAPNVGETATLVVQTQANTASGVYPARVSANAGAIQHTLPINVQVTHTSVTITDTQVLDSGGVAFPNREVPSGAGMVTLRVTGTGLLGITFAQSQGGILTDVPGATATQRDWTFQVPHGACTNATTACPFSVFFNEPGNAGINQANAFAYTAIVVDGVAGSDVGGRGTWASPVQSLDRAAALAGVSDVIVLHSDVAPGQVVIADGVSRIAGDPSLAALPEITCTTNTPTGLHAATGLAVDGVHFTGCDAGVLIDDNGGDAVSIVNSRFTDVLHPVETTVPGTMLMNSNTLTATAAMGSTQRISGGTATFFNNVFTNVAINASSNSRLDIAGGAVEVEQGDAITIGAAVSTSTLENLAISSAQGDGLHLQPGAKAMLSQTGILNSSRGLVVDGATATLDNCSIHGNGEGITVIGASPSLTTRNNTTTWNNDTGVFAEAWSGTSTLMMDLGVINNTSGMQVRSLTGAATNLSGTLMFTDNSSGLKVTGGTVNITQGTSVSGNVSDPGTFLVWIHSGNGTIHLTNGAISAPQGNGVLIEMSSQHVVDIGVNGTFSFDMTGHRYDGDFGIAEWRNNGPTTQVRASFKGSDHLPRAWHGTFHDTGSYSGQITPRDLAAWKTTGTIDFGP